VGDINLTEHGDTFSRTIRQKVPVSGYPLALWLAANWWRLLYEPRPPERLRPTADWRLAHEWPAANAGTNYLDKQPASVFAALSRQRTLNWIPGPRCWGGTGVGRIG
jgi:hypothetical protein